MSQPVQMSEFMEWGKELAKAALAVSLEVDELIALNALGEHAVSDSLVLANARLTRAIDAMADLGERKIKQQC